jgi:hypothetical protein
MNLDQQARTIQVSVSMQIRHTALLGAAAEHLSRQLQHLMGQKQAMKTAASSGSSRYSERWGHRTSSGVLGSAAAAEQSPGGGWQWDGSQAINQQQQKQQQEEEEAQQQQQQQDIWQELLPGRRLSLLVSALRALHLAGYPHTPLYQLAAEVLVTSGSLSRLASSEVGGWVGGALVKLTAS